MEIILQRFEATQKSTPGTMSFDDQTYQTLEPPPVADPDEPGCPVCIPAGRYKVTMAWSNRHNANVPMLLNVPGRTAIEIHYGNWVFDPTAQKFDSEGCILVGMWRENADEILGTKEACINHVWPAIAKDPETWIEIREAEAT